jgi:hypothetical protein
MARCRRHGLCRRRYVSMSVIFRQKFPDMTPTFPAYARSAEASQSHSDFKVLSPMLNCQEPERGDERTVGGGEPKWPGNKIE